MNPGPTPQHIPESSDLPRPPPLPPTPPARIDYGSPGVSGGRTDGRTAALIVWVVLWLTAAAAAVSAAVVYLIPKFRAIFADFRLEIPLVTKVVLALGRFLADTHVWVLVWLLPVAVPLLVLTGTPDQGRRRARHTAIVVLAALAFLVLCVFALYLPTVTLIEGMTTSGQKK